MQIEYDQLRNTIAEVFRNHGVGSEDAQGLGRELADATFAGYESHGIGRVKPYLHFMAKGTFDPAGRLTVVRETPATALLDAGCGFGILRALEAADIVIAKARSTGLGAAALRNCGDVARLAPYAERIAEAGLIGLVMANDAGSGLVVAPHGGTQPLLSTNPLAVGLPRPGQRPLAFDLATSQIAVGAAKAATRRGTPVPEDTLIGPGGEPVTDPQALFDGLAALLPLGGAAFGFKGTALGLLVEVLAGGLTGDGLSGDHPDRRGRNAVFLLALDPAGFGDVKGFHGRVDAFLDRIRTNPPRPGVPAVRIPGEHGPKPGPGSTIPILEALWEELQAAKNPEK
jgi:uncharacterized oxidoreductase